MKKLKVLVIPTTYPSNHEPLRGIFFKKQSEALAKYLDIAVLDFDLLSLKNLKNYSNIKKYSYENENNVKTFHFREFNYGLKFKNIVNSLYKIHIYKCFEKVISEFGMPDIIHAHSTFFGGYLAYLISKKYNIPYVVTEHFSFFKNLVDTNPEICKNVFRNASEYMAVGNVLKDEVEKYSGRSCSVVPNYVDLTSIKSSSVIDAIKNNGKFNIINISLLKDIKNIPLIINALDKLINTYNINNIHFHLIGDGPSKSSIENLITKLNLNDYCTLYGMKSNDEISSYLKSCNCLVISSKKETFCVSGIEAMSCGLPVISTKCGGPETYVNSSTGILVENNDIDSMAEGILNIMKNYNSYNADDISLFAEKNFSEQVITSKLIKKYNQYV